MVGKKVDARPSASTKPCTKDIGPLVSTGRELTRQDEDELERAVVRQGEAKLEEPKQDNRDDGSVPRCTGDRSFYRCLRLYAFLASGTNAAITKSPDLQIAK
jgi:hypothetical protein